jgi:hypothetical protein
MRAVVGLVTALLVALVPASAVADEYSRNMSLVKNMPYQARNGDIPNFGTDIQFATVNGRQYALAGSYRNGMQIVDITNPRQARRVAVYDCGITQGDVQIFRQASKPGRVFAGYTSDTYGDGTSTCYREAAALGFNVKKETGEGKNGTFIVELTNPSAPKTRSFVEVEQGSHNHTIHPSGRYLYNSNSDLMTSFQPAIEVFDISNFAAPRKVTELAIPTRPGLGTESHDISFSKDGKRAYSAALSQGVIIDTSDPAAPVIVTSFLDPAINVWHQAEPFTLTDATGAEREFLIVEDEVAGAVGTGQCPNGGVHVYDITGENEKSPVKVGYWNIDEVRTTTSPTHSCTAHVFDIHQDAKVMTIAYYNGGVRVVDLSGLAGISLGGAQLVGQGMRELGFYRFGDANSWSAKTPAIDPATRDFYLYGNDIARGLDVYRFDGGAATSASDGTWLTPAQALARAKSRPKVALEPRTAFFCLLSG